MTTNHLRTSWRHWARYCEALASGDHQAAARALKAYLAAQDAALEDAEALAQTWPGLRAG